jgi:hypothetical protein
LAAPRTKPRTIAEGVYGVKDVNNQIKVKQRVETETGKQHDTDATGRQRERKAS